jgi:DNA-binding transcriptional LysR family regulator
MFLIGASDTAMVNILPALLKRLQRCAPTVGIGLQNLSEYTPHLLESGRLDLAIGFMPPTGSAFCQQRLFKDRFMCAVRANHSEICDSLTLEQFEREYHLVLTTPGSGMEIVEKTLETNRIRRKVGLRIPGCSGIASIITGTDCLAVVPEQLGRIISSSGKIRLLPVPFPLPLYYVVQLWHEQFTHDSANKWIRGVISDVVVGEDQRISTSRCEWESLDM